MITENPAKQYIVAFDFDGVIWDSVDECFHTGRRLFPALCELDPENEERMKKKFRQGRYLAKTGDDFFINFRLMEENPNIDFEKLSFELYHSLRDIWQEEISDFAGKFYAERERLQKEEPEIWSSWQGPIPGIMEQLPVIRERFGDLAVCSTKDKATIELILDNYGQKYSVYGREHSKYKPDQINDLAAEKKINPNRIIFIDDLIENLQHVKTTGAICVMTRWGYNNPAEWKRAADLGFKLISMNDIAGQLEEIIKPEGTE